MKNTLRFSPCALCATLIFLPLARSQEAAKPPTVPSYVLSLAGYAPLRGEGVVVTLSDRQLKAQPQPAGNGIPGLVHDFDLLAVVNELRAARATGISVGGVRLTNQTAIRCVGPTILVGGRKIAIPVRVEATGNAALLQKALTLPNGIAAGMKATGPRVEVRTAANLRLPAAPLPPNGALAAR